MTWDASVQITNVLKRDSIRKEIESSLRRLGVDVIDLCQIHWPRVPADIEEAWETLARLKDEGKIRYIGVSNFDVDHLERVAKIAPITSLQPPYSILNRTIEPAILPYAAGHGIGVIAYAPMQNGLLSGKMTRERAQALPSDDWRRASHDFQEPQLSRNLGVATVLGEIAHRGTRRFTVPEVAIAWVLQQLGVTAAIVGARQPAHVDDFLRAEEVTLDADDLTRIQSASA